MHTPCQQKYRDGRSSALFQVVRGHAHRDLTQIYRTRLRPVRLEWLDAGPREHRENRVAMSSGLLGGHRGRHEPVPKIRDLGIGHQPLQTRRLRTFDVSGSNMAPLDHSGEGRVVSQSDRTGKSCRSHLLFMQCVQGEKFNDDTMTTEDLRPFSSLNTSFSDRADNAADIEARPLAGPLNGLPSRGLGGRRTA